MAQLVLRLRATGGQLTFPLSEDVTSLGRSSTNRIVVRDPTVSRTHANVVQRDGQFFICDLDSSTGTYLNDARITGETSLQNGDRIKLGRALLVFRADDKDTDSILSPTRTIATAPCPEGTEDLDSVLSVESIAQSVPAVLAPMARQLSDDRSELLAKVASAIQSVCGLDELLAKLLDAIIDVFRPDRGVILLYDTQEDGLTVRVARPEQAESRVSRSIVNYAVEKETSVLVPNAAQDARFNSAVSITALSIQAAVCCPLISKGKVLGALYIDTKMDLTTGDSDLVLLNMIAANAAVAIENAILVQEKLEATHLGDGDPGMFIGQSAAMEAVRGEIDRLSRSTAPVLVAGERGTGKLFAAKTIHKASSNGNGPFIAIDCGSVAAGEQPEVLFGAAAAGGFFSDARPGGNQRGHGALFLADGGTLVLQHVGALSLTSQKMIHQCMQEMSANQTAHPRVRLIATTATDLNSEVAAGRFLAPLAALFMADLLTMPPLRKRKEDIIPLAQQFLSGCASSEHECDRHLNRSAQHALRKLQYRHRNASELRDAIEFAAQIADEPEIGAEHIFTGPREGLRKIEYDLGQSAIMQWLVHGKSVVFLKLLVLALFSAIAGICLFAGGTVAGRIANGLVWGLWWPALLLLFLLLGRLWCPFCPISMVGRMAQKIVHLDRKPPDWLKKETGLIMVGLFLAIVWSEYVFHMPSFPFATGVFLLSLMSFSVFLCVVYQREVWCRYMCPLGAIAAGYSIPAPLHLHSTASICATECKTHECFKGSDRESGCPVFIHPLYVRDSHFCKLCFACLRSCRHDSARPYFSPHLRDIWARGEISMTLVPFCLIAFFMTPAMLASHRGFDGIRGLLIFGGMTAAAAIMTFALHRILPRLLSREGDPGLTSRVAFGLLVLGWGPFMAFHLENIPHLASFHLRLVEDVSLARILPVPEISALGILQLGAIALACGLAAIVLSRIRSHAAKQNIEIVPAGWRLLAVLCAIYSLASAAIVIAGGGLLR